jgi:hypothetical protein
VHVCKETHVGGRKRECVYERPLPPQLRNSFISGTLTTGSIAALSSPGEYCCVLTAYMVDAESDVSNEVSLVIKPKAPKLNSVQQIALGVKNTVTKFAGLFRGKKQLRIIS